LEPVYRETQLGYQSKQKNKAECHRKKCELYFGMSLIGGYLVQL